MVDEFDPWTAIHKLVDNIESWKDDDGAKLGDWTGGHRRCRQKSLSAEGVLVFNEKL